MSLPQIKHISVAKIQAASNIGELLDAYAQESALAVMPEPMLDWDIYEALEESGGIIAHGAYVDDTLVGFMVIMMCYAAQYSADIGNTMLLFVLPEHRRFGTGKKLVDSVAEAAFTHGMAALAIGAPSDSRLAKAAESMGFKETNRVYLRTNKP